jgi:hypothetical protein
LASGSNLRICSVAASSGMVDTFKTCSAWAETEKPAASAMAATEKRRREMEIAELFMSTSLYRTIGKNSKIDDRTNNSRFNDEMFVRLFF